MKNHLATLAAAVLAASAAVASPALSADAHAASAKGRCGYTGCIHTVTAASGPTAISRGQRPDVSYRVRAVGNTTPKGFAKVVVTGDDVSYHRSWVLKFTGKRGHVTGARIKKAGTFTVRVRYIPSSDSNFYGSGDRYHLKVTKR